jgi:Cas7 group CRISPR-associated protein Csh2
MNAPFNRHAGLMVVEVTMSNPNGDPEMESEPRVRELDGLGMISPVSVKRKYRDLVDSPTFMEQASAKLNLSGQNQFQILEKRGRDRKEISSLKKDEFIKRYWDARLFGNTFLEGIEGDKELAKRKKDGELEHLINTGVLQIGVGLSVAPVRIERMTYTNKSGVEGDKDRGMAPLAYRAVAHGIYYIPFFVNPSVANKTGATSEDLELFKFITPYLYEHTTSAIRPQISILHAWCAEHKNVLGSCPEYLLIDALKPKLKAGIESPSSRDDYVIPTLADIGDLKGRFKTVVDLNDLI